MINGASFAPSGLKTTPLSGLHPAVRLSGAVLALVTCMAAAPAGLAVMALVLTVALAWTGMGPRGQLAALRPWAPVAVLVIIVHTFTTTWAAPLGHPSTAGALAAGKALLRVACSVGCLGLYLRVTPLDDLVLGVGWWLRPARRAGLPTDDLGLMLAVAMGTAPVVLGEGRRIEAVVTMRRSVAGGGRNLSVRSRLTRWAGRSVARARVVVPLLENLARRAEALTLSLRHRRPDTRISGGVPFPQLALLGIWTAALVWYLSHGGLEVVR
ncbi:MAG: energy-coupling factor transporter transmembrane component T [Candidatus Krumholzibacteriota bacterium]